MFGVYLNKRLTKKEQELLNSHPDDYNWYCIISRCIFKDSRWFQVRDDIELPQEDDNGSVLIYEGGDIVYVKSIDGEITDDEVESISKACEFLYDKFNRPIKGYIPCAPFKDINVDVERNGKDITLFFSYINVNDGEKIIERLENKLKNHEKFSISDSIDHMLLPYTGYANKEDFYEKLHHYNELVETYDCEEIREV